MRFLNTFFFSSSNFIFIALSSLSVNFTIKQLFGPLCLRKNTLFSSIFTLSTATGNTIWNKLFESIRSSLSRRLKSSSVFTYFFCRSLQSCQRSVRLILQLGNAFLSALTLIVTSRILYNKSAISYLLDSKYAPVIWCFKFQIRIHCLYSLF